MNSEQQLADLHGASRSGQVDEQDQTIFGELGLVVKQARQMLNLDASALQSGNDALHSCANPQPVRVGQLGIEVDGRFFLGDPFTDCQVPAKTLAELRAGLTCVAGVDEGP